MPVPYRLAGDGRDRTPVFALAAADRSARRLPVPVDDPLRPQRVPAARPAVALLEREVDVTGMGVLQQPRPVGLLLGAHEVDRFVDAPVGGVAGGPEVLQSP